MGANIIVYYMEIIVTLNKSLINSVCYHKLLGFYVCQFGIYKYYEFKSVWPHFDPKLLNPCY